MTGIVYLIHFAEGLPVKNGHEAKHYLGFSQDKRMLGFRLNHHRNGTGSALMGAISERKIDWVVTRIWEDGSRTFERNLKNRKEAPSYCPICVIEKKLHMKNPLPPNRNTISSSELEAMRDALKWYRYRQIKVAQVAQNMLKNWLIPYEPGMVMIPGQTYIFNTGPPLTITGTPDGR